MLTNKLRNIYKYIYFYKKKRLNRNKQGKIFVSHVKIAKQNYYENSDWAYINNQKRILAEVNPLLSYKTESTKNICLFESRKIQKIEKEVVNILYKWFVNMIRNFGVSNNHNFLTSTETSEDTAEKTTNIIIERVNH